MIEKILDNYYSEKLIKLIKYHLVIFYIDVLIKRNKKYITILIKNKDYNDKKYKELFRFNKSNSFEFMTNSTGLGKFIYDRTRRILKGE